MDKMQEFQQETLIAIGQLADRDAARHQEAMDFPREQDSAIITGSAWSMFQTLSPNMPLIDAFGKAWPAEAPFLWMKARLASATLCATLWCKRGRTNSSLGERGWREVGLQRLLRCVLPTDILLFFVGEVP